MLHKVEDDMMEMSTPWSRAIVRALKDKAFKSRLVANPTATLTAAGVDIPVGVTVKVVENTANQVYMVLPDSGDGELSDNELERVAAGVHPGSAVCNAAGGATNPTSA
jgi:hypothetical protein